MEPAPLLCREPPDSSSGGASYQSIKICSWRPINAFVWPFPFLVIYGCCVTWWFIATGASLLFIATDLQPLSCELWMSYQAGSKKWQINRKPECPHRHLLPFTCIFSKPLACGMIVPYSMISYLGLLGNQTAIKWRTYIWVILRQPSFYKMKTCFGIASNQQRTKKFSHAWYITILTNMAHRVCTFNIQLRCLFCCQFLLIRGH